MTTRRRAPSGCAARTVTGTVLLAAVVAMTVVATGACTDTIDRRAAPTPTPTTSGPVSGSVPAADQARTVGGEDGGDDGTDDPTGTPGAPTTSFAVGASRRSERTGSTQPATVEDRSWPACPTGEHGRLVRHTVRSDALATTQPVQRLVVYLPPCFDRDAGRRYPVLYLLHGAQADETQWLDAGLPATADTEITTGRIAPAIIVLVDALWAMGQYAGTPQLMDRVLLDEVAPAIEGWYPTIADRAHRAIGGISRGGEWALLVAGHHPNEFGAVGGHSAAVGPPGSPDDLLAPLVAQSGPRVWLDVGSGDGLTGRVTSLSRALDAAGLRHELHVWPGGHDRAYWGDHVADYLHFYDRGWGTTAAPPTGAPPTGAVAGR